MTAKAIKETLGHIDCPTCGTAGGMRITRDKNGDPFGYSEACCNQQLRIGGDRRRVAAFVARYPWAADTPPAPAPKNAPEAAPAPAPKPARKAGPFDFLMPGGAAA